MIGVDTLGESNDPIHPKIYYSSLSSRRVSIFKEELRNKSMDKDKVVVQLAVTNDTTFNTLLEITQKNDLVIHNLAKDMDIIKKNTSWDDDINDNE